LKNCSETPILKILHENGSTSGIRGNFWLILAHLALFDGMALFIVGVDFLAKKIIRKTTEIKVFSSKLIKLSMKFSI
jgi:hypothetical protein